MLDLIKIDAKGKQNRRMYWLGVKRGNTKREKEKWYWDIAKNISGRMNTKAMLNGTLPWGRGEPGTVGDCVAIDSALRWKWNSVSCSISAYVICENNGVQRYHQYSLTTQL